MSFVYFSQAALHGQEVRLGKKQIFMLEGLKGGQQSRKAAESEADMTGQSIIPRQWAFSHLKFWKRRHDLEEVEDSELIIY